MDQLSRPQRASPLPGLAVACLLGWALMTAPAEAQAQCTEGRVITADTAGRCCWPGQRWSEEAGRCEGPPACPLGTTAEGDSCVAPSENPARDTVFVPAPTYTPVPPPPTAEYQLGQPAPAVAVSTLPAAPVTTRPRLGLVIPGAVMVGVPYVLTATIGSILVEHGQSDAGVLFVPALGPLICAATCDPPPGFTTMLVLDGLIQVAGLVMFIAGFADPQEVPLRRARLERLQHMVADADPLRWTF